ncbi:hypothetical protein [Glutamicibacter uratoxydans]|uniref:hypothetical protein n=1 Tax=Glutamicibacter uratoxydans TaxID=43667 RepID=UPI003D6F591D
MSFKDKAKEVLDSVVEKVKDPDGSLVERTWPAGEAPVPETTENEAIGADPDLDASPEDQYDKE